MASAEEMGLNLNKFVTDSLDKTLVFLAHFWYNFDAVTWTFLAFYVNQKKGGKYYNTAGETRFAWQAGGVK